MLLNSYYNLLINLSAVKKAFYKKKKKRITKVNK